MVVPSEIRKRMKLTEGTRFVILGFRDTIVLRKLELSEERLRLKRLLAKSRERAKKVGFSEKEIQRLLDSSRKATA